MDQLEPVGPGSVLAALIGSGRVPVISLRQVFRQSLESNIVASALAVHRGAFPDALHPLAPGESISVFLLGPAFGIRPILRCG